MDDRFSSRGWHALLLAAAAVLLLTRLGGIDLWAPDEPRYAQIAEEVRAMERGPAGLFLLSLNGQVYNQKPPAYYWLAALAGAPGGRVTEAAARLPSAVAGIGLVVLVLGLGSMLLGRASASVGAAILLTAGVFPYFARRAQLDVLLSLFETLALLAFWRLDRGLGTRRSNLILMHGSMGVALLTKGPVGLVVPVLVMTGFLVWEGRARTLRSALPLRGLALSLLPVLAWIALASALAPDGYFRAAVIDNLADHFVRGVSKPNPWYYFFVVLPLDFLPWTALWPLAFVVARSQIFRSDAPEEPKRAWRFLLAWVGVTFAFFSISSGKRDLYLLPCFPAIALLCGDAAVRTLRARAACPPWFGRALGGLACVVAVAALVAVLYPWSPTVDVPFSFAAATCAGLLLSIGVWRLAANRAGGALGQLSAVFLAVFALDLAGFTLLFPALEAEKSPRPVALAAAELAPPGEPIGLVEQRPAVGGLAYYSGRRIQEIGPAENLRRFFDEGGHVAVISAAALERVGGEAFTEIRARFRTGKRATLVVTAKSAAADTASAPVAAPDVVLP